MKTIGILGAGQLGRMLALEAYRIGLRAKVYSDKEYIIPAPLTCAPYNDEERLRSFAEECDVITFEFENIPSDTIDICNKVSQTYPSKLSLEIASNRFKEKSLFKKCAVPTNDFAAARNQEDLEQFLVNHPSGAVIKTASGGYDGKGQWLASAKNIPELDYKKELIVEEQVSLKKEISVLVARSVSGETIETGPFENEHVQHILRKSFYPASVSNALADEAKECAKRVAIELKHVGVICVEFFVDQNDKLLANEIAPRVHNSAHLTIDAASHSQFELHLRAILDLGFPKSVTIENSAMLNILGSCDFNACYQLPGKLHLYGKQEKRPNRKCGHLTLVAEDSRSRIAKIESLLYDS